MTVLGIVWLLAATGLSLPQGVSTQSSIQSQLLLQRRVGCSEFGLHHNWVSETLRVESPYESLVREHYCIDFIHLFTCSLQETVEN